MGRNKAGWGEKGDAEEGKVRAGSSKPPWGRSQTGRSRKLPFVIPGSGRGKEEGTANSRQGRGDAGGG